MGYGNLYNDTFEIKHIVDIHSMILVNCKVLNKSNSNNKNALPGSGVHVPLFSNIIGLVPMFPKSDVQNFRVPYSPKLVLIPLNLVSFLKIFASVPLFPENKCTYSLVLERLKQNKQSSDSTGRSIECRL